MNIQMQVFLLNGLRSKMEMFTGKNSSKFVGANTRIQITSHNASQKNFLSPINPSNNCIIKLHGEFSFNFAP